MEGIFIKLAYALVGFLLSYIIFRQKGDTMEKLLLMNIKAGKRVVIAVDKDFMSYEMVNGKVVTKSGELDIKIVE